MMNNIVNENQNVNDKHAMDGAATMADDGNAAEEKLCPEAGQTIEDKEPLDDTKTKFINGGSSIDDTKVEIHGSVSDTSFTGLGKEELKKYEQDPFWVRLRWVLFIVFWVGWVSMLVAAIVIIVLAPRCPHRPDLKWYHKDVSYNVYAKSFFDGGKAQDGYGDLEGIQKKKDYIAGLNADTVWLSSILKTEGNNDRAVLDHTALDQKFGTVESLKAFCKERAKNGKRVIMDLIPNQTSRNHTWFMKSQKEEGKYASYYVWADPKAGREPNAWEREDGSGKMWVWNSERQQYYLSQFDGTADLNLTNENVIEEFKKIMQFWAGQGISGFHINDLEYLTENPDHTTSLPASTETKHYAENVDVVDALRGIVDGLDNKPGREKLLVGTVRGADSDKLWLYNGGTGRRGLHVVSVVLDDLDRHISARDLQARLEPYVNSSTTHWIGWRLSSSSPGSQRVFNRVGMKRMTIAHALQMLLPGSALPYYGDELAMEDGPQDDKRTVSPMQWSKGKNAGFTQATTPWLPLSNSYTSQNVNSMTAQLRDHSVMKTFKSLTALRTTEDSLLFGHTMFCSTDNLLIFARHAPGFDSFLVVANLGPTTAHRFGSSECASGRKTGKLVFHSHNSEHEGKMLKLYKAIHIDEDEVLVLKLAA
ncbi:amino acid transporter heavy chain SLC3A1-like [Babylonia areolata]|uniref:amino acid transporter heavy chain SLC3A1-like n=1 Tax=Babylonia areolata TaxID=304850 RepID=UPI003FD3EAD8